MEEFFFTRSPEPQHNSHLWQGEDETPLLEQINYSHSTWPAQTHPSLEYVFQTNSTALEAQTIGELLCCTYPAQNY